MVSIASLWEDTDALQKGSHLHLVPSSHSWLPSTFNPVRMSFPLMLLSRGAESQGEKGNGFLEPGMGLHICNSSTWEEVENLESSLDYTGGLFQQDKIRQENTFTLLCQPEVG